MKIEIIHVDTCLSGYWSGHHNAHLSVPVWHGMTFDQMKSSLHSEISQGAICGSDTISELLSLGGNFSEDEVDMAYRAAHDAIDGIVLSESADPDNLFEDLDETEETEDGYYGSVYAYFLLVEAED